MKRVQDAKIDMYEQLPVPYGLVRFGVAPDHPEVKNCQQTFSEVAQSPRFTYIGNIRIGHDLPLTTLKPHYDALIFAYGASEDRRLLIPGEDLCGVYSAREFVGWYNGLPQFANLQPELELGEQAVVIGQGNVALDVARILLSPVEALRKTDITEEALERLERSKVKSVKVVGRRGPLQAAFTVKEVRELMKIPSVGFTPIDSSFYPADKSVKLPRVQQRISDVLRKGSLSAPESSPKNWALQFLLSPKAMNPSENSPEYLSSIDFTKTAFAPDADTLSKEAKVIPTEETTTIKASLAFRSVGYKSTPLPGLTDLEIPFDTKLGIIPNDAYGRVMTPITNEGLGARHIPGIYCAGWVKRGPTGVIASTMEDAFATADIVAKDWEESVPFLNSHSQPSNSTSTRQGWDALKTDVIKKGIRPVSWDDWKVIDAVECERGRSKGKEREKIRDVGEMLGVLDA
ncbi:FAD/NAD(P)-binding domain-containing protein [Delitschia confertaspora ATCC 74209]|uniref:NADPH:adrenodoxin oxidoreductase, mitochondrial n=1 Tax=Delitschia confertaspora ATCC 74209 TaxID=1513339 RepID=A0A9P4JV72_9PLEO|nr:FAD/NAD(P)-binding domain-containing protein [Delitschia confertaspora ATCC 74209]